MVDSSWKFPLYFTGAIAVSSVVGITWHAFRRLESQMQRTEMELQRTREIVLNVQESIDTFTTSFAFSFGSSLPTPSVSRQNTTSISPPVPLRASAATNSSVEVSSAAGGGGASDFSSSATSAPPMVGCPSRSPVGSSSAPSTMLGLEAYGAGAPTDPSQRRPDHAGKGGNFRNRGGTSAGSSSSASGKEKDFSTARLSLRFSADEGEGDNDVDDGHHMTRAHTATDFASGPRSPTLASANKRAHAAARKRLLRTLPFFQHAPDKFFTLIEPYLKAEHFKAGTPICVEGDYGDKMYFLTKGVVQTFRRGTMFEFHEGDFFGELAVLKGTLRVSTCTATVDCDLFILSRAPFLDAISECPEVKDEIEKTVLRRFETEKFPFARREDPEVISRVEEAVEKQFEAMKEFARRKISFTVHEKIGTGAAGVVYAGFNAVTGQPLAIKTVYIHGDKPKSHQVSVEQESQLMQRLQHPNLIVGYGMQRDPKDQDKFYILMELAPMGSLHKVLRQCGTISEVAARNYIRQALLGLQYLHKNGVLHRDIKPSNMLLGSDGTVKLADFGISKLMTSTSSTTATIKGTPAYMSPDAINGKYSIASDIWAVGCSLLEMITGHPPWHHHHFENPTQMIFHIATCGASPVLPRAFTSSLFERQPSLVPDMSVSSYHPEQLPEDLQEVETMHECSPLLITLLMHMLALDPQERLDCASLLAHDWFVVDESKLQPEAQFSFAAAPEGWSSSGRVVPPPLSRQPPSNLLHPGAEASNTIPVSDTATPGTETLDGFSRAATVGSPQASEIYLDHPGTATFEMSAPDFS